ncbi:Neopullulanase 1 precursor [Cedecea neteri]|uniref:Neopullulanase 1 n=1 Tax=Cedecea neteri TaxID=158822 RepID=A0A2X2SV84_9ENTR|nr:Neopullulanase 1 precursor [Cedecea neteri]
MREDRIASRGRITFIFIMRPGGRSSRREWDEPLTGGGRRVDLLRGAILTASAEKLPYLKKLGVTALYLNPVFTAPQRGISTTLRITVRWTSRFGGNAAFLRLRENTRRQGMKLMLDGVFNHSGDTHAWFDRHQQNGSGACHNPQSPWRDWYSFSDEGLALDWLGYSSLPKLDYRSATLVDEIYRGEQSIVRHWLREPWGIDGWRLDVVHMLGEAGGAKNNLLHVSGITRAAKETKANAYVLGRALWRCPAMAAGRCRRCRHELSRFYFPAVGIFSKHRYLLRAAGY